MTKRIAILVFDGFDIIDAGGPYEVFLTASRLAERDGLAPQYEVNLVSPGGEDVVAYGGMTLTGLKAPDAFGSVDMVLVPGTIDVDAAVANPSIVDAVELLVGMAPVVTSVCTGAFLLARVGVLEGRPVTTHWEDVHLLEEPGRTGPVARGVRWVDDGDVVTSGGLTSGIHMALHLVARDFGVEHAIRTARQLGQTWNPEGQDPT